MDLFTSSKFSTRVSELIERYHVPGLAIGIIHNDKIASLGFGSASVEPYKPCTPDTLFDIASSSKSLTAASVALLVDDNETYPEVQYESLMSELLPEDFVMSKQDYTEGIALEDILSHRTGLPPHDDTLMGSKSTMPDNPRSITRNLRNLEVAAPIRSKYMYSNIMFTVAAYLVEKKSGLTFSEFLRECFFRPLSMNSTNLGPTRAREAKLEDRLASGHFWDDEQETYQIVSIQNCPEGEGAGSVITSVNDYIFWIKAILNQEYPINKSVYQGLVKPRIIEDPEVEKLPPYSSHLLYCTGFESFYYRGFQMIYHDGLVSGFGSRIFFLPELKFGGVIFGNASSAELVASVISRELIDHLLQMPDDERPDWEAIESEIEVEDNTSPGDESEEQIRERFCPGLTESHRQTRPLEQYTGTYQNAGYKTLTVKIENDQLSIDASDRSMGFVLKFEHVCEQTKYIAHLIDNVEGGDDPLRAEFEFEGDVAVKMGLHFEAQLDNLIWFTRT